MSGYRAFLDEDDDNDKYVLTYYHNPTRWNANLLAINNPIRDANKWSKEIKYMNDDNTDVSDEIKNLPKNTGGIYIFYLKGLNLPHIENYVLYVGRCKYTKHQNINKRAKEYLTDKRPRIMKMFRRWKSYLYYRYFPDTDNDAISNNEIILIRAIAPEYNEDIPDKIEIRPTTPAF